MNTKIKNSLKIIDYKLILSLLIVQLVPTLYSTLRVFFLGQIPGEYSFSIAGQLSWVNLLYEIFNESIILPLFYLVGKNINDRNEMNNCIKSGIFITFCIYFVLAILILILIKPLLAIMSVNKDILSESAVYIRIECVASIFSVLASFLLVVLVVLNKVKYLYILTGLRLILTMIIDMLLVSSLPCSLNIGVNGIAISNIIVNIFILSSSLYLLSKENILLLKKQKLSFSWLKDLIKIGGVSGLESLVRNLAYMFMISRMVNIVNEQGTYWVANSFIWGWLLLPTTQLGEYIKKDVATDAYAVQSKTLGYLAITTAICLAWFATIPLWKSFMFNILLFDDVDKLYNLVIILIGFYVLYAYQNVFDATFYGMGKTNYMLFESVATNALYYGTMFVLYITKIWAPTLTGIALMFGFGMVFDGLVSLVAYIYLLKKKKIYIWGN